VPDLRLGLPGILSLGLDGDDLAALRARLRRSPHPRGACVLVARDQGCALDVGREQEPGWSPWKWPLHGQGPQQWLVRPAGAGAHLLVHGPSGLALTAGGDEGSRPTVERACGSAAQRWELRPTGDGAAVAIRSGATGLVLDATRDTEPGAHPVMWSAHGAPWQQWLVARLPAGRPQAAERG
jgi:hypothetical protein